jgi:hypothetical protein
MTIGDQRRERCLPLRGEVWDAFLPQPVGDHPVVVLTGNALIPRLRGHGRDRDRCRGAADHTCPTRPRRGGHEVPGLVGERG